MSNEKINTIKLLNRSEKEIELKIESFKVSLTHLDKILWPKKGITKKNLALYYIEQAGQILPELKDRPITVLRCIEGVGGECFYQRHFDEELPSFIKLVDIWTEDKKSDQQYICINNLATLLWLVNREVVELHSWLSKISPIGQIRPIGPIGSKDNLERSALNYPNRIIFDLDPHVNRGANGRSPVRSAAILLKIELDRREMKSWVKTTGLGGLHVISPIRRTQTFEQTRQTAKEIAEKLSSENSDLITASYREEDKEGKVLIDYSQNAIGKSLVALGSPRSNPNASISTKVKWSDIQAVRIESKNIR